MSQKLANITKRFVILCEGQHDAEFFKHLLDHYKIPDFEIYSVNYAIGDRHGGDSKFGEALDAIVSVPGFAQVEKILIVADNDGDPVASFKNVVDQINTTADIIDPSPHRYVAPVAPHVKGGTDPVVVVYMMPRTGTPGNFTDMCVTAAYRNNGVVGKCVDDFAQCSGAIAWTKARALGKFKLRSMITGIWEDNPLLSPAYVWSKNTNIVPVTDPVFDDLRAFLQGFHAL